MALQLEWPLQSSHNVTHTLLSLLLLLLKNIDRYDSFRQWILTPWHILRNTTVVWCIDDLLVTISQLSWKDTLVTEVFWQKQLNTHKKCLSILVHWHSRQPIRHSSQSGTRNCKRICMGKGAVSQDSGWGESGDIGGLNGHLRIWLEALLYRCQY